MTSKKRFDARLNLPVASPVKLGPLAACYRSLESGFKKLHKNKKICSLDGKSFVLDTDKERVFLLRSSSVGTKAEAYNLRPLAVKGKQRYNQTFELALKEGFFTFVPSSSGACGYMGERLPFVKAQNPVKISNEEAKKMVSAILKQTIKGFSGQALRKLSALNGDGTSSKRSDIYKSLKAVTCSCGGIQSIKKATRNMFDNFLYQVSEEGFVKVSNELQKNEMVMSLDKANHRLKVSPTMCSSEPLQYALK